MSERSAPPPTERDTRPPTELERLAGWLDSRTGMARVVRSALRKVFPDHWTFLLGEVALFCFVILVLTGTFLTFFYVPSSGLVVYDGPYEPLRGELVSAAYDSVMRLSFEVRAGLLMRQIHHWTALVFVAVVVAHLCRVFFTGAFRRPRELNWLAGFTLLVLVLALGLTGYTLPDDLLSGTGARITYSAALSIPFIGPWVASLLFGGEFPTAELISRFFVLHIFLLPALVAGLIVVHIGLLVLQKHTQYRGGPAREDNVVGRNFWPGQVFLSSGLFFLTAAAVALIGGLFQVNPIWAYGPFDAAVVSSPAQPDWYVGWLDGALRVFPPFEPTILGVTIPSPFIPGIVIPGIAFTIVALWPFIEARITGDREEHHLLDRWWEHPVRTATGVALLSFFGMLTLAGGNDVLAFYFGAEIETLTLAFRVLVIGLPIVAWIVVWRLCRTRLVGGGAEGGPPAGRAVRRTPEGGFEEVS
jgi:ubiquinol-cytochrome c reductase cytochrome b subunit